LPLRRDVGIGSWHPYSAAAAAAVAAAVLRHEWVVRDSRRIGFAWRGHAGLGGWEEGAAGVAGWRAGGRRGGRGGGRGGDFLVLEHRVLLVVVVL
jgi:hypothetical protein